jgi:uncharacterized protein YjbI with pentapeptide repeats
MVSNADLSEDNLRNANFNGAVLNSANLREADLSGANLTEADLQAAYLREANLNHADLTRANLSLANLADSNLNEANLNLAKLWGIQTLGWSIKGVACEWVYWDKEAKRLIRYERGEFEKLYSEKPVISMIYEGGIRQIEMIVLPDITAKLSLKHPGCSLRLKSIAEGSDSATVEIAIEESGTVDLEQLKRDWKTMQVSQRKVLGILDSLPLTSGEPNVASIDSIAQGEAELVSSNLETVRQKIKEILISEAPAQEKIDKLCKEIAMLSPEKRKGITSLLLTG